jgi:hypothetical protein
MWMKLGHLRIEDVRKQHDTHRQENVELNQQSRMAVMASVTMRLDPMKRHTMMIDDRQTLVDGAAEREAEMTGKAVDSYRMECYHELTDMTTTEGMGEISGGEQGIKMMRHSSTRKRHCKASDLLFVR